MNVTSTSIPDVLVFEPKIYKDERGFFFESFNERIFTSAVGKKIDFVQDNHSRSSFGVLRGLHYQTQHTQGKLIRVVAGEVFDVAVDLRKSSPTFGQWVGEFISSENHKQMWIPPGFAHGFLVTSSHAELLYKTTDFYSPNHEKCLIWDDPSIGIKWPELSIALTLSTKDQQGLTFNLCEVFVNATL